MNLDKVIIGIDPGTSVMGYGVINIVGKKIELETAGTIHLSKFKDHTIRLKNIFERSLYLIEQYKPDEMAIEAPFYGKNVQSMLKLGRAQGITMAAALYRDIPIFEYAPKKVKQSITGNGNASKEQVAAMLVKMLDLKQIPKYLDATDGLAVAVAHHFQGDQITTDGKSYGGWGSFIKNNPGKVKKR
jgi:crossover junction endodeoxyribonuclease RuvC